MVSIWLLEFGDNNFHAIEAETGLEVFESRSLTRLPLSNPKLAGLALVEGKSLIVADLAACLDLSPPDTASGSLLFRLKGHSTAFLAPAAVRPVELPDFLILPLPKFLANDCLRGCILVENQPTPLIDLHQVQENFSRKIRRPGPTAKKASPSFKSKIGKSWRIVRGLGGKPFALPEHLFPSPLRSRPDIAALGGMPAGVIGVYVDNGKMLPVWSLGSLLSSSRSPDEIYLLEGGTGSFDLAVTVEGEEAEIIACQPLPLPAWCRRPGIERAILAAGELIPCLQLEGLIQADHSNINETPPSPPILPLGTWEVTEFRIAGNRHAVLKEEVTDVLPPLPWSRVPGLLPIIEGIAHWQDEIWPVVNLSCYFGRLDFRENGCMIALQRGSHRLLLLAEKFEGQRLIEPENQRPLPLKVPHSLVSGCYLDGDAVILLLDAPALVHHFDPSLLRDFCSVLQVEAVNHRKEVAGAEVNGGSILDVLADGTKFEPAPYNPPEEANPFQENAVAAGSAPPETVESPTPDDPEGVSASGDMGDQPELPDSDHVESSTHDDPEVITASGDPNDQPEIPGSDPAETPNSDDPEEISASSDLDDQSKIPAPDPVESSTPDNFEEISASNDPDGQPAFPDSDNADSSASENPEEIFTSGVLDDKPETPGTDPEESPTPDDPEEISASSGPDDQSKSPEPDPVEASTPDNFEEISASNDPDGQPVPPDSEKTESFTYDDPEEIFTSGVLDEQPEIPDTDPEESPTPDDPEEISASNDPDGQPAFPDSDNADSSASENSEEISASGVPDDQPEIPGTDPEGSPTPDDSEEIFASGDEENNDTAPEIPPEWLRGNQRERLLKNSFTWTKTRRSGPVGQFTSPSPFARARNDRKPARLFTIMGVLLIAGLLVGWWLLRSPADLMPREAVSPGEQLVSQVIIAETEGGGPAGQTAKADGSTLTPEPGVYELEVVRQDLFPEPEIEENGPVPAEKIMETAPASPERELMVSDTSAEPAAAAGASKGEPAAALEQQQVSSQTHPGQEGKEPDLTAVDHAALEQAGESEPRFIPPAGTGPYVVRKGDTLWHISGRFLNNPKYYNELARENRIPNANLIYPEQILVINPVQDTTSIDGEEKDRR